ncbi:MAG: HAMP domain-containing sensor histidine kinase [Eubacteriales bacterium]|nr:HAMP domain-containing sensor histidine kinase [Eubacteriales bacterium]
MRKTLYLKFVLGYLIFGFFGFLVVATFVSSMTLEHLKREKADSLYKEATLIADTYASDLYSSNTSLETVKGQLDALSTYLAARIWIINPSGRIIMTTDAPLDVEHETVVEDFDPTVTSGSFYTVGDFFGWFDQETLSVFAPITASFKVQGYVVIHLSMASIRASSESLLNISYIMLIIFFLLSLIILIFFTEMVYLPLRKITAATEQYAAGNMHYELQVDSEDEIGYLAASLSYMASEIARGEDNQKKFIANVSHDFRSPLTSIRGYLEAMLDGTIPAELHEKYLGIVLNETERLTKLTNSLLTLNNLNMKGMVLEKTRFDLNRVIRSTAASFEGTCQAKHIGIELVLTGDEMPVLADKSKIEQVLYNLLDNAIKFSHSESAIKIETTEKHGKVFVSVKDSGIGIPKDSLRLIFDRFYKTDLSRGKDKKGTGLGLSITKEIIQAHGENINVISTEGVGSEFIFSLPVAEEEAA